MQETDLAMNQPVPATLNSRPSTRLLYKYVNIYKNFINCVIDTHKITQFGHKVEATTTEITMNKIKFILTKETQYFAGYYKVFILSWAIFILEKKNIYFISIIGLVGL